MLARFTRFLGLEGGRFEFEAPTIVLLGETIEIDNKAFHVARVRHSAGGAYSWGELAPGEAPPPPPPVIEEADEPGEADASEEPAEEDEPAEDAPTPAPKKRARKAAPTEEDEDGGE